MAGLRQPSSEPGRIWRTRVTDVAQKVAARIADGAGDRDRERIFPSEQLAMVRESGLEAVLVPVAHGGPGGSLADALNVTAILSEGDLT